MVNEADIRAAIASAVVNFDSQAISVDEDFYESGLDSLDHASILLALQENSGLTVPDEALEECRSISGIIEYASKKG